MAQRSTSSTFGNALNLRLVLAILSVACVRAKTIDECNGLDDFIVNPNELCQYMWIFCSGDDSYYCSDTECMPDFDCQTAAETTAPSTQSTATTTTTTTTTTSSTVTPTTSTTAAPQPTPSDGTTVRRKCQRGVYDLFPFPDNCNYYYRCFDGYLYVEQCPFGHVYDAEQHYCSSRQASVQNCRTL